MLHEQHRFRASERHLVCLDLVQRAEAPSAEEQLRIDKARRLIVFARAAGWTVSHVHPRTVGRSTRPLTGLEPLPSEPLYYRSGVSAFSNRAFSRVMKDRFDQQLVILALTLSSTSLGTALSAYDHDLAVTLVGDTLRADAANASGLQAIETVTRALVAPFVQIRSVGDLIDQRRGLRLVSA